jgi:hypothetical protein
MPIAETNLVVCAFKKKGDATPSYFSLPVGVYTDPKYELKGGDAALPRMLVSQGTVVANMPNDQTGTGGFCYLVNIPALAKMSTQTAKLNPTELMTVIKGLSRRTSADEPSGKAFLQGVTQLTNAHDLGGSKAGARAAKGAKGGRRPARDK